MWILRGEADMFMPSNSNQSIKCCCVGKEIPRKKPIPSVRAAAAGAGVDAKNSRTRMLAAAVAEAIARRFYGVPVSCARPHRLREAASAVAVQLRSHPGNRKLRARSVAPGNVAVPSRQGCTVGACTS